MKRFRLRRRHMPIIKFWVFMTIMAVLPPWLWLIAMSLIVISMFLFAFGFIGLMSPLPSAKVLMGLGKRRVAMNSAQRGAP